MSRWLRALQSVLVHAFVGLMALVSVAPFGWMVVGATNTSLDITNGKLSFGSALAENIAKLAAVYDLPLVFWNSTKIAVISTVVALALCSLAGYGFEVFASRARERVYVAVLLTMMVPFAALMIPLFTLMANLELLDTHAAVVLPTLASAFLIFYFRQSGKAFPHELREAAMLDGLREWEIFLFIYVPVMRSTYAAAFIITFMAAWNGFLWPLIALQSPELKTITLVISSLGSAYTPDFGLIMVAVVLATMPMLLIFFLMQRQFVQGLLGSVK